MFRLSVKGKITTLVLMLALVPTLVLGVTSYFNAYRVLESQLRLAASQSVAKAGTLTQTLMGEAEHSADRLSMDEDVITAPSQPKAVKAMAAFKIYRESHPDVQNVYYGTAGKQMFVYPRSPLPPNFDPTSRPWYKLAVEAKGIAWTEPYIDTGTKKLVVSVAKPVLDPKTGKVLGVVGIDISLDTLSKMLGNIKIGNHGYVIMVDKEGKVMVHPDSSLIGKTVPIAALRQALTGAQSGSVNYAYQGQNRFGVFETLPDIGWKIIGAVSYNEIQAATGSILWETLIASLIVVVLAILLGLWFSDSIVKNLKTLVQEAKKIGGGDFTVRTRVKSKDEIGALAATLNGMVEQLGRLMGNVKGHASQVSQFANSLASSAEETSAASEEVTATVTEIAAGASEQAAAGERTAALVQEMARRLADLAASSEDMAAASAEVRAAEENGAGTVGDLTEKTNHNSEAINKIEATIYALNTKAQSIGEILQAINSIAEQTNLLALNASIEAARAGDAGRGFSVVADEIRKLAEQSSKSTAGIRTIIFEIQKESGQAVAVMAEVRSRTRAQVDAVHKAGSSFQKISAGINEIAAKIQGIFANVEQVNASGQEMVQMIGNISSVSQQTAASSQEVTASMEQTAGAVEEVARTAEKMNELAAILSQEVDKFKI
ncbi:methyl-accepting chemotaxis protein McpA [Peptococcaceae bacterium CEB3]|nr:methyl-accepting chemotaxis protein McpA [Peptococcaceae bacterium CEB3]